MGMIEIIESILSDDPRFSNADPKSKEIMDSYLKSIGLKITHVNKSKFTEGNMSMEASMHG